MRLKKDQIRSEQNRTEQNRTEQNRTEQNRTEQNSIFNQWYRTWNTQFSERKQRGINEVTCM